MAHRLYDISALQPYLHAGCVFLTPNARLARRVKAQWDQAQAAAGLKVWSPLAVFPLEPWLLQRWQDAVGAAALPGLLRLSKAQELQLWQQVILEQSGSGSALINPAGAAELASAARDLLLRWRLKSGAGETPDAELVGGQQKLRSLFSLDEDCARYWRWQDDFERELQQRGLCTTADCLSALQSVTPTQRPDIVLLEPGETAPLLESCLRAQAASVQRVETGEAHCDVRVHPFADSRAELKGVARWAAKQQREAPGEPVAIVFNGTASERAALEYELRREFNCLGEDYASLPVNFSAGMPLSEVPVVRTALTLLELIESPLGVARVVGLFNSRFVDLPDAESPQAQAYLRGLYDGGSAQVDAGALRSYANRLGDGSGLRFGECLLAVSTLHKRHTRALPSGWTAVFNSVLDIWAWPGPEGLDSLEYQQVKRWYETLDEFAALDEVCAPVSLPTALQLLRGCCARKVSHPETADSAVQVLGPLEAAGLNFEHTWLLGMQRSAWPPPPRPNPLIPVALQAEHGMPHATPEREWQYARKLLDQFTRGSAVLHASYSTQLDGANESVSSLLAEAPQLALDATSALDEEWLRRQSAGSIETRQDHHAPALTDAELEHTGGGSALLEAQSNCGFRAFARYRLNVAPLGEFSAGLSAQERGTLVHEALHCLWQEIDGHTALLALQQTDIDSVLEKSVAVAVRRLPDFRRIAVGHACLELEANRLRALLLEWLQVERARDEFRVLAREQDVEITLARLTLKLRVDRVDELPDGSAVVIDYKTGASNTADWLGERPAKPQLLLYGMAGEQPPAAITFAQVRPDDCKFVGLGSTASIPGVNNAIETAVKGRMDVSDWESLNAQWRKTLHALAEAFVQGEAAILPLSKSCTYCGLQPLCRINWQQADHRAVEANT